MLVFQYMWEKSWSFASCSVEDVGVVVFVEKFDILLASSSKAVKKIIGVGSAELRWVLEGCDVAWDIVVLLDCLDNVSFALDLEELLGEHDVRVVDWYTPIWQVTVNLVKVGRVTHGTLVVGNRPLWGWHYAQGCGSFSVCAIHQCHLRETGSLDCSEENLLI